MKMWKRPMAMFLTSQVMASKRMMRRASLDLTTTATPDLTIVGGLLDAQPRQHL
jgi:hypothetical protein